MATLSITYLVLVASAVAQRHQLATYVAALGDDVADVVVSETYGARKARSAPL